MNKHLIVVGVVIILLAVGFSGCTEKSDVDKIIGIWDDINSETRLTFTKGKNVIISDIGGESTFEYGFMNNIILFYLNDSYFNKTIYERYEYEFLESGNLVLTAKSNYGNSYVLRRYKNEE